MPSTTPNHRSPAPAEPHRVRATFRVLSASTGLELCVEASYQVEPKIQDRLTWAGRMFKKQLPQMDALLKYFRAMDTDQAQLFATFYAVWNELLSAGDPCTAENITQGLYAWQESKKRLKPEK